MAKFDEIGTLVLDWLVEQGGGFETEPGELLKTIAEATEQDYFAVAMVVRKLESLDFVQVGRWTWPDPRKANRLYSIHLV